MSETTHIASSFPRILFAGGGTGGHVYPAIAIADAVKTLAPQAAIAFAGTKDRIEWRAVPKAGYPIYPIRISGLPRRPSLELLRFPFRLLRSVFQSWRLVGAFDPTVVVGTGGFVSGPVLWAAHRRKRQVVLQEQNAFAGLTNKLMAKKADQIHIAFPEAQAYFPKARTRQNGNPIRGSVVGADRAEALAYFQFPPDVRVVLVMGGSGGSAAMNQALKAQVHKLLADENVAIIWQTGRAYFDALHTEMPAHPRLHLCAFIDRMDYAYAAADLAVARSGASTCTELLATGTPSLLVPSPNVTEDHQTKNAKAMVEAGAGQMVPEADLAARLGPAIQTLLTAAPDRANLPAQAHVLARPTAAQDIARDILALTGWIAPKS